MSTQRPFDDDHGSERQIFLERRGYRQRRFVDAARLLPIVGLLLWFLPLVWPRAEAETSLTTSNATLYIFAIWVGLIILGAFLAWKMAPSTTPNTSQADGASKNDKAQKARS